MGLIQKKDEKQELDGIEIIGRGEGPDGLEKTAYDLVKGESAEDIAAGTTDAEATEAARAKMVADAQDEALMDGINDADDDDDADDAGDDGPVQDHGSSKRGASRPAAKRGGKGGKVPANHGVIFIVAAVVLVIVAAVGGFFVGQGGFGAGSKGLSSSTISEDQLSTVVATWSNNGKTEQVTAKEAIESQYGLDAVKDSDGNYPAPSAETIVSYVRNKILLSDAEKRGITVSDDDAKKFAQSQLGSSDFKEIASSYQVTEDQAKQIVKDNATLQKLYDQVVPNATDSTTAPTAPTEPSDGDQNAASKDYADYIINLAGDEWDSSKGTWAKTDGDYYAALKDEQFTADSATYAQAQKAYAVAYSKYTSASQESSTAWSKYANGLYAKANVSIYGLYV